MGLVSVLILGFTAAGFQPAEIEANCYDAHITARVVGQVPTVLGNTVDEDGEPIIIMSWPWILDLAVQRVHSGELSHRRVRALSIQHPALGARVSEFYLRKNDQGGYNFIWKIQGEAMPLCSPDQSPARAYYVPAQGKTLADARRDGLGYYGRGGGIR